MNSWSCGKHMTSGADASEGCLPCVNDEARRKSRVDESHAAQRKRDRFELAKAAMQGLIPATMQHSESSENQAELAIEMADALLAELDKGAAQ